MVNVFARSLKLSLVIVASPLWACAVFEPPRQYRDPSAVIDFDARPQATAIIEKSRAAYQTALNSALQMEGKIEDFLAQPDVHTLAAARQAWRDAREHYQHTEWMRFVNGPIDWPEAPLQPEGPEARLNAWPLNEAVIDYVKGAPTAGLINNLELPLSLESILAQNQVGDENDVTTGWHAIEFLLWGQDFSAHGPGNRSHREFRPGDLTRERRRTYLRLATQLLISDLRSVLIEWDLSEPLSYASRLSALPSSEIIGPALHGAASLLAIELHGERFAVPLDSGMQEDEHSCFSDNTLADLRANLAGIVRMLGVNQTGEVDPNSLLSLIEWKSPRVADQLKQAIRDAELKLSEVPGPFDQLILSAPQSEERAKAEAALVALQNLAVKIKASSAALGLQIVVPGV